MEDDDLDLLLALQPDDLELDRLNGAFSVSPPRATTKKVTAQNGASKGAPEPQNPLAAPLPERSPRTKEGATSRAYHSPEADKPSGPRGKKSLSAAFGRASAGIAGEAKGQESVAAASEARRKKPQEKPGKGDNIEAHSGIRIKNPLLPSIVVKERFAGSRFVRLSKISSTFQGATPASPWSTVAVLAQKMTPREGAAGRKYGLWKITDLTGFTCTLFLFGDAFEAHWKESEGSVVGLVNPKYKDEKDEPRSSAPFSLSAESGQQVFKLGTSADLALCRGTRKDGMPCTMIINKSEGDYCHYHAAGAYQKLQKLQKAQEKGHRIDLGKGKLSREPHGRVMSNVYISEGPVNPTRVLKLGKANHVKPSQLQEVAEQEMRKRSNSQGSRQALGVAAAIQQQREKKLDKNLRKGPGKDFPKNLGASKVGPTKPPLEAQIGAGAQAGVTRADKVTSAPKPASRFDIQSSLGKENLVAGATLGLQERERKRQQMERNRLRAKKDGMETERNGIEPCRAERNGMERKSGPSGADGKFAEGSRAQHGKGGVPGTENGEHMQRNGERTERNGTNRDPAPPPAPTERDARKADGRARPEAGSNVTTGGKTRRESEGRKEATEGKLTEEALREGLKAAGIVSGEAPKLRVRKKAETDREGSPDEGGIANAGGGQGEPETFGVAGSGTERGTSPREGTDGQKEAAREGIRKADAEAGKETQNGSEETEESQHDTAVGSEGLDKIQTEGNGFLGQKAGGSEGESGEDMQRNAERTERTAQGVGDELPFTRSEEGLRGTGGNEGPTTAVSKTENGTVGKGKLSEEALRAGLRAAGATDAPKLTIERQAGTKDGVNGKGVWSSDFEKGREEAEGLERSWVEKGRETGLGEGKAGQRGIASDERLSQKPRSNDGKGGQNGARKGGESRSGVPGGSGRTDWSEGDRRPSKPEQETERKHRNAGQVLRKQNGGGVRTASDSHRAKPPVASDGLQRDKSASEKRPSPDGLVRAEKRSTVERQRGRERLDSMRGVNGGGEIGGSGRRHVAGGERAEKVREHGKPGSGAEKGGVDGGRKDGPGVSGFKRPRDEGGKAAKPEAPREKWANGDGSESKRRKEAAGDSQSRGGSGPAKKGVPTEGAEMRPRVQKRTAEGPPREEDRSRRKRRVFDDASQLNAQEKEELLAFLVSGNQESRSIIAGQRINKVSASCDGEQEKHGREDSREQRGRPAEGHVASKQGFAAAFRDVAGVEQGPRESVFRDMGDAEEIERALGSFDVLEKKEELAAKMDKIHSVTVKGWRCDQCRRSTEKKPDLCVAESHPIRFCTKLVKRFWACTVCKERTDTVGCDYPIVRCRKCNGEHFKPTGMRYAVPTKETPYAARENFMARGKEHAFSLRDE